MVPHIRQCRRDILRAATRQWCRTSAGIAAATTADIPTRQWCGTAAADNAASRRWCGMAADKIDTANTVLPFIS